MYDIQTSDVKRSDLKNEYFVFRRKKRLYIEVLYRPLFTKYALCKPLFPFQNNA